MPRKKSRPTHRENAATVPSNEGGFYKMFWNSMDTNPGTNGPNSPSQGDVPVTSPVIIINDSPADSPCALDENSCENIMGPLPIKEETCEDALENSNRPSTITYLKNVQESHCGINRDCSSLQTCLPGNPMTSPSKNSLSLPCFGTDLISVENPPQTANCENFAPVSTCMASSVFAKTPPNYSITEASYQLHETPHGAEEDGDQLVEDIQVCDQVPTEKHIDTFPESNLSQVVTPVDASEEISSNTVVVSNLSHNLVAESRDTPSFNETVSLVSQICEVIAPGSPAWDQEQGASISQVRTIDGISALETLVEMPKETPMDVASEHQSPVVSQINDEENTQGPSAIDIFDSQFSTVGNEENVEEPPVAEISSPPSPALSEGTGRTLSLLKSLLNAPDEDLEDFNEHFSELPALIGQHNAASEQNTQNEGDMVEFESAQESSFHSSVDISNMDIDQSTILPENVFSVDENLTRDDSLPNQTNEMTVNKEEDKFPTLTNFLPKKIKLDSIGILRSVKVLKDSVRALYKEYLKDDVILRTVSSPEPPVEDNESSDEVQENPTSAFVNVYPICCVKMERLPDPFVKKTTVTMSDDTFKTWKRQIMRQRNEEKFRHLKVWRRGRTLLWRECELAGMDRVTYDEQVSYVKKHMLSENSSSDGDSSGADSCNDASSHQYDSSEESSSDEDHEDSDLSSMNSYETPPHTKQKTSENQSIPSPHIQSETSTDIRLPGDEYVVERTSTNQSSTTKAPSALKITIRKTSMSKSEEEKEKPTDEENFPVPAHPIKTRKVATKRTFRRPTDPVPKANIPSKSTAADTKKSKSASVENEDLYDQSLLGRRSYEVENFNLLEKWDIPFEEPTLFRSPRAASRLAQLKTKEAFAPVLKRHAPPKTSSITPTTITTTAATAVSTSTVSKEVKDVVEWLCSKTVEAMLFPESKSAGTKKPTKTDVVKSRCGADSNVHMHPNEVTSKSLVPSDETSSNLDESSEMSQSETNSTLDASSDFGGSTASLVSEDFVALLNDKSPQKSRRRRRVGPAWYKKKKAKGKASDERHAVKERFNKNEHCGKDISSSPVNSTEQPFSEIGIQEKHKPVNEVCASSAHSTQVPVVSEGPGQSPHESEEDSARGMKRLIRKNEPSQTVNELIQKKQPAVVIKTSEPPSEESQPNKEAQEEVILPRLTRSKQPTVELEPGLLENFGMRKRKSRTEVLADFSQDEDRKKPKQEVTKKTPQKSKPRSNKASAKVAEELSSTTDDDVNYNFNTQVPEVSEGPGEVGLDHENKHDEKKVEWEPPARMLRSWSRGPRPTKTPTPTAKDSSDNNQRTDESVQVEEDKPAAKIQSEESLDLESPQSPPPEPVEPEPLINSRITRSKKRRSGPAYVAVKSTGASVLPSVCDIVDSIAGQRLPTLSKLFDDSTSVTSLSTEPITVCRLQTSNVDKAPLAPASPSSELGHQQKVVQNGSLNGESVEPPATLEGTCLNSKLNQSTFLMGPDSSIEPIADSIRETPVDFAGKSSELSNKPIGGFIPCLPAAAVDGEKDAQSSGDASSSGSLPLEKPVTENVGSGRLEVLDTLNTILAVSSPTKVCHPVSTGSPSIPPPLNSDNIPISPPTIISLSQPSVSNILTPPAVSSTSLPTFPTSTQDISNILPGTFLNSLLNSTLDASLTTYSNDSTSLPDDPDGDLVIDEGEAPEPDARIDVNFWENLTNADFSDTNADFSDDDNNTDLADKIDKIIKDQIHQDPVPVPSVKPKENVGSSNDGNNEALGETSPYKCETDKNSSALNRRDSIDERTGLPNNLIQRLRDPRIRSRLLSHLEEVETNDKIPQSTLALLQNCLPMNNITSSTVGDPQPAKVNNSDLRRKVDSAAVQSVSYPVSTADSTCLSSQAPAVSSVVTNPIMDAQLKTISSGMPGEPTPLAVPNTPLVTSGTPSQLRLVAHGTPIQPVENSENPEEPPDPSQVDFLVPPSDDEEDESTKRRPSKKAKKEVDVELMYKSPLEDLQSEARPAYGERAPRRYADNFPRKRGGDDRQSRWDDRRSRIDDLRASRDRSSDRGGSKSRDRRFENRDRSKSRDRRFEDRGRSQSRDRRFDDRGRDRSRSRDQRAYLDRPPRDQSRDRRAYDPYCGREEHDITPHHVDMQVPYNLPPWPVGDPAFNHHQTMMMHPRQSPHWQPNYYPEPYVPPHPPIFMPEPPKIDYMETRLINLELLPKTTNLEVTPVKKVYSYFDKDSLQIFRTPPPMYDPNDQPHTIKMMDPVSEEMIDFIQTPRPTSGLTKEYFRHVPPDLNLDDVVKFHFISPAYVMVQDNEEDPSSSSDEEKEELDVKQKIQLHHRKSILENKKHVSKPVLHQMREGQSVHEHHQKQDTQPMHEHHSKRESESIPGNRLKQEGSCVPKTQLDSDPLQNLLQNLPLLQRQYSLQKSQPPMIPPPPPEWNDVDLRMSRELATGCEESPLSSRNPSPPKERSSIRSRSRSKSPYRSRRSRSPRRRRRSRSRSSSFESNMSISPSRSRSRSPSFSRTRTSRRRRSRSRSSELSRSRRSRSPKRHSASISPSRQYLRR